jgi:predicted dehydrogenase
MSTQTLKLAFIGGAPNSAAGYAHFAALRMDNRWELQAGAFSRHADTNMNAAETYGVAQDRTYENLSELLKNEKPNIDAVVILTPTDLHYKMVQECLKADMPVICEKSLCLCSNEGIELERIRKSTNGFLAVIYNYSGYPMVRELRKMIHDGVLGKLIQFQVEMPQEGYLRTDAAGNRPNIQTWRRKDGPIPMLHLDLAVHLHELLYYLTGLHPVSVISDQSSMGWLDVIDNVTCLCKYSDDVRGQVWFSKCALGHRNGLRLRLYGTKASAEWYQLNPEEIVLSFADGRKQVFDRASNPSVANLQRYNRFKAGHPAGFVEGLANLYCDISTALTNHKQGIQHQSDEVFGADLSIEGLLWLEAMVRSCTTQTWESVK